MSGRAVRKFERLIGRTDSGIALHDFSADITESDSGGIVGTVTYDFENQKQIFTEAPKPALNPKTLSNNK